MAKRTTEETGEQGAIVKDVPQEEAPEPETAEQKAEPLTEPDAVLVKLRRAGDPEQPVTCVTAEYKGHFEHWHTDPQVTTFQVPAYMAAAAVATGAFEETPDSRVKLKR